MDWPWAGENFVFAALKVILRVMGTSGRLQKICEGEENEGTLSGIDCLRHQNVPGAPEFKKSEKSQKCLLDTNMLLFTMDFPRQLQ